MEDLVTAGCSYLPGWLLSHRHHVLVACPVHDLGCRLEAGARVRVAEAADAERLLGQGDLRPDEIAENLERGDVCVLVEEEDLVLASAWASTGEQYLAALGVSFEVPEDAFYVHDTFTHSWARRRGLATLCYQRLFDLFAARSRSTAYAAIEMLNQPSRDAHARWGFVPVGRCRTVDAGPLRITFRPRWPVRAPRFQARKHSSKSASS